MGFQDQVHSLGQRSRARPLHWLNYRQLYSSARYWPWLRAAVAVPQSSCPSQWKLQHLSNAPDLATDTGLLVIKPMIDTMNSSGRYAEGVNG